MNFGMIKLSQSTKTKQNYVTWILSFVIYIKTEDLNKDIANDVEEWFDTSNYIKNDIRSLPIGENEKIIVFFKDKL